MTSRPTGSFISYKMCYLFSVILLQILQQMFSLLLRRNERFNQFIPSSSILFNRFLRFFQRGCNFDIIHFQLNRVKPSQKLEEKLWEVRRTTFRLELPQYKATVQDHIIIDNESEMISRQMKVAGINSNPLFSFTVR